MPIPKAKEKELPYKRGGGLGDMILGWFPWHGAHWGRQALVSKLLFHPLLGGGGSTGWPGEEPHSSLVARAKPPQKDSVRRPGKPALEPGLQTHRRTLPDGRDVACASLPAASPCSRYELHRHREQRQKSSLLEGWEDAFTLVYPVEKCNVPTI